MTRTATMPSTAAYRYRTRSGHERTGPLVLYWEMHCDPITDDYTPDEISAVELWRKWVKRYGADGDDARIYWFIEGQSEGTFEAAPFDPDDHEDFLTFFSWPVDAVTGRRIQFTALPVVDKLWHPRRGRVPERSNKGGFVQEATGWKPSAFQRSVHWPSLLAAAGIAVDLPSPA